MKRCTILIAVLLLRLGYGAGGMQALELGNVLTGYTLASWREADGLSLGRVAAITQDPDGYLWLGTDAGLVRFDGLRFEVFAGDGASALPSAPVRSLLFGRDGRLWIGYAEGAGVYVFADRRGPAQRIHQVAGTVSALEEPGDGSLWVGHDGGLGHVIGERWRPVPEFPASQVQSFFVDQDRTLWVATMTGAFVRAPDADTFRPVSSLPGAVRDLSADGAGQVWSTHPSWGFQHVGTPDRLSGPSGRGNRLLHDSRGNLWVATTGQGLWRVRPGVRDFLLERTTVLTGLLSDGVFALFEDREGNIWAGTQEGLNRLTPHRATPVTDLGVVRSVAVTPDGAAWAAGVEGLIRVSGVSSQSPGDRKVWPVTDIQTLHVDRGGTLWIATRDGLHPVIGDTIQRVPAHQRALRGVTAITSDHHGGLWLAERDQGILVLRDGRLRKHQTTLPSGTRVDILLVDRSERLWLALGSGQVLVSDVSGPARLFDSDDGLPHGTVSALVQDSAAHIWVGGDRGLSRLAGNRFVTIDQSHGLPRSDVAAVVEDADGFLWLGIRNVGIIRLHPREFDRAVADRAHRVRYEQYGTTGGVAGLPITLDRQNTARAPDGRLWFVTGRGLTVVEPRSLGSDWVPPPTAVRIETATADEQRFAATDGTTLPAGTSRLRIDYTALSLTYPDRVRFRYWLEGFDADWVDVGTRRQAIFTNLPPGRYRFRVQARTNEGAWSESSQTWRFAIEPALYQTRAFQAGIVGLLAVGLWGGWRMRLRTVRREISLVFAERTRLSREIHDTLLQSFVGLALQVDYVARTIDPRSEQGAHLRRIKRLIEEHIREARLTIWDLRSPAAVSTDLAAALRQAGERATEGTPVRFDLTVTGEPRACSARVKTHVLRIAQEAFSNAVRHGHPNDIRVELAFRDHTVALNVVDDGCGFDPDKPTEQVEEHYGLAGMRERAEDVGGWLTIAAASGGGTRIETVIPLAGHA